ncbi:sensor histidine kinase [Corynebacterium jeikeium]|uniref:sensor histidine kinase n=1 Tax=Corynebacterium macclintockiae TaxID=2913501 RepID=UPI001E4B679C
MSAQREPEQPEPPVQSNDAHGSAVAVTTSHPGHFLSHYPLRVSLVVVIAVLVAMGLSVSGVSVTTTLQRFLIQRVDEQLDEATNGWAHRSGLVDGTQNDGDNSGSGGLSGSSDTLGLSSLDVLGKQQPPNPVTGVTRPPSDFYVLVVDEQISYEYFNSPMTARPEIRGLGKPTLPVTVGSREGSGANISWRATSFRNDDGTITIVALPLEEEEHIISRLVLLQVIIGLTVVGLVILASMYLVRRALRPLNEVELTASKISNGDLGQRVPNWRPNTEVGRLSLALNKMLAQIQSAFVAIGASERQARRSEASMRRFIGDASHELRTPLTSVRGYAELYQSGATDDAPMVIDRISEEASRMSLLVEDLLALVRMDEGRPLAKKRVDMLELVLESAESARAGFPNRTVQVVNETGEVPIVVGDVNRLHQVFSNLLTNALRHAGEDAEVTLRLDKTDDRVIVDVEDNGQGIPAKDLPHLFERFYRPDVSRSRMSGGSGLGLSIVKGLVEAHGGSITVHSVEGEGTRFRIELPEASETE